MMKTQLMLLASGLVNMAMKRLVGGVAILLTVFAGQPAWAAVLSYDGFGTGYTAGPAAGQAYQGTGYAAGGSWNNNDFAAGGLTHASLTTTPGVHVVRTADNMIGLPDLSLGGNFGAAGLIGDNGNIGGGNASGTLYFSFLGREIDGSGNGWMGFNLYDGDDEGPGIGHGSGGDFDYAIVHVQGGINPPIGTPSTPVDGNVHFFVGRMDYVSNGKDIVTAWLDPNPLFSEAGQAAGINTVTATITDDDNQGFNAFRMRGGNAGQADWEYDEIRFGETWADVTPTIPEPSTILLALMGFFGALGFGLRRRRKRD